MREPILDCSENSDRNKKLQKLHNEILQVQNESQGIHGLDRVQEIIKESSKIVENSNSPNEMIVDAKILHTGTNIVVSNVSSLNTNLTSFNESKYISGLLPHLENSCQVSSPGKEWSCFAPFTYHLFRKSHSLTYMLGTLALEAPPPKEKTKAVRQKKKMETEKKVLCSLDQKGKAEEGEIESDIYKHILKWLMIQFKKNRMKPVSYFNFIIDPTSYWRTVENIFHFAFLVRDGVVKMQIKRGLPYVEPKKEREKGVEKDCNYHFCFTLSIPEWKRCIKKFVVESPCIPPFVRDE